MQGLEPFGDNFIPVIPVEDGLLHTAEHPFCYDPSCPCHENQEAIASVYTAVCEGELTPQEATDFVNGKMV